MADDAVVAKLAAQFERIDVAGFVATPEQQARMYLRKIETARLAVLDPHASPYSFLTHEMPPTMELAVGVIGQLANQLQHARNAQARAWDEGASAGWEDCNRSWDATQAGRLEPEETPNPYRQEASRG